MYAVSLFLGFSFWIDRYRSGSVRLDGGGVRTGLGIAYRVWGLIVLFAVLAEYVMITVLATVCATASIFYWIRRCDFFRVLLLCGFWSFARSFRGFDGIRFGALLVCPGLTLGVLLGDLVGGRNLNGFDFTRWRVVSGRLLWFELVPPPLTHKKPCLTTL